MVLTSKALVSSVDLTRYYILALLIVGSLAIGSHLLQQTAIENEQGLGAVINVSGRQRMLSQRIASLAAQYRLGDLTAKPAMLTSVAEFEAAHARLSRSYAGRQAGTNDESLHVLYFEGGASLNTAVQGYVAAARQAASLQPDDPAMQPLLAQLFAQARQPLLAELDRIVAVHQAESEARVLELRRLQWVLLSIMLTTLLLEAFLIFRPMVRRIVAYNGEILHMATVDSLTGVSNRREFLVRARVEWDRALRHGSPVSILALDIDHFKRVNDTYGHAAGDAVLRRVAGLLRGTVRSADVVGRLGGEEFAIVIPETGIAGAARLAERLRVKVAEASVTHDGREIAVTMSLGCVELSQELETMERALEVADKKLYEAKHLGRDRVVA